MSLRLKAVPGPGPGGDDLRDIFTPIDGSESFIFYFSKRDSRTWVPKSIPWMGWTVNLGKPAGAKRLIALFGLPVLVLLLVVAAILAASH